MPHPSLFQPWEMSHHPLADVGDFRLGAGAALLPPSQERFNGVPKADRRFLFFLQRGVPRLYDVPATPQQRCSPPAAGI